MKKIFATLVLALAVAVSAFAQPKAIGGRFGYSGLDVDYQHYLGNPNFLQVNAGLDYIGAFGGRGSVLYNITFAQPNWTSRGDWAWYAGAGLSAGWVYDYGNKRTWEVAGNKVVDWARAGRGFMFSIPVQVGLSYTFWFPLQLSVDIRPYLGIHSTNEVYYDGEGTRVTGDRITGFYNTGLWGLAPTLSVHYAF